jgi:hypothetical protein
MVRGLDIFKKYFEHYPGNYVIIGGTACDIIIDEAGLLPRATKDIDIILVVEALSSDFVQQFWKFIKAGGYGDREKSNDQGQYYRFKNPGNTDFPHQIELFSRAPDMIVLEGEAHLTPIPADDELSSLSAILLNDDYYNFMIEHSQVFDGLHHANIEALICLKVKAYLEIKERIEKGSNENAKHLRKHKADVFRLTVMLTPESIFKLPETIQVHVNQYAALVSGELPDKAIFKEMGLANVDPNNVFEQFKKSFGVNPGQTEAG